MDILNSYLGPVANTNTQVGQQGPAGIVPSDVVREWTDSDNNGTEVVVGMLVLKLWDDVGEVYRSLDLVGNQLNFDGDPVAKMDNGSQDLRAGGLVIYDDVGDQDYYLTADNTGLIYNGFKVVTTQGGQTINGALTLSGLLDLRKTATANILQFSSTAFLRTDTSQLSIFDTGLGRSNIALWRNGNFVVGSSTLIAASSGADATGNVVDTALSRNAAGVWQMGTTAANALGSLVLTNLTASGTLRVGGGTVVTNILSATATLDFPSINSNTTETLTITVTGAVAGDSVFLGVPSGLNAGLIFCASVTAADTVTVRMHNPSGGAVDPASGTFRATVIRF